MTIASQGTVARAIVLAAGHGQRMGGPKALLEVEGRPLATSHVERLTQLGCAQVVVVLRPHVAARLRDRLAMYPSVVVVAAETASQSESLATGVRALANQGDARGSESVVITPVDMIPPALSTHAALRGALARGALAATPLYRGKSGHPVVARRSFVEDYAEGRESLTFRDAIRALGPHRVRIPVDDPAVAFDFDVVRDVVAWERGSSLGR